MVHRWRELYHDPGSSDPRILAAWCVSITPNLVIVVADTAAVGMYIVARMILGFGIPTCIVSGSSLIGELGYPKERPVLTSL